MQRLLQWFHGLTPREQPMVLIGMAAAAALLVGPVGSGHSLLAAVSTRRPVYPV